MDEKTPEEQTPETPEEEKIKKQKKSNENFLYNWEVGQLINDLNTIKIKLQSPDSKKEFKDDLIVIKTKYNKIARLGDFSAGNKSRCINLKITSNKTKKIKVKRFRSRRNKK
jgi:hypothetical protein